MLVLKATNAQSIYILIRIYTAFNAKLCVCNVTSVAKRDKLRAQSQTASFLLYIRFGTFPQPN